ncbi:hypothetical protein PV797_14855 [Clostridiaceae bacterium M8S5]|nr:hypothetical protein PV797_14855 [Clostridiaceae bacterium M8S5]
MICLSVHLIDGLRRIRRIMEYNCANKIWDEYIDAFNYWKNLKNADIKEIKRRFKLVSETMWYKFNSHQFAEAFNRVIYNMVDNKKLQKRFKKIREIYWQTHDICYQIIALNMCRDWSSKLYDLLEWGMCENVITNLRVIKENDDKVFALIKECVQILEKELD